jgi:hypothetical protein
MFFIENVPHSGKNLPNKNIGVVQGYCGNSDQTKVHQLISCSFHFLQVLV